MEFFSQVRPHVCRLFYNIVDVTNADQTSCLKTPGNIKNREKNHFIFPKNYEQMIYVESFVEVGSVSSASLEGFEYGLLQYVDGYEISRRTC